jgi:hypothetical protein
MHQNKRLGQAEISRLVATSAAGTALLDFIMLPDLDAMVNNGLSREGGRKYPHLQPASNGE